MSAKYYTDTNGKLQIDQDCTYIMLVMTNANANNNKFYELTMDDSGHVTGRYGRVGYDGTKTNVGHGFSAMCRQARSKFAKGYHPVEVNTDGVEKKANVKKKTILECAIRDLVSPSISEDDKAKIQELIQYLVESNRHEIIEFSQGQITVNDDGLVKTAIGVVSLNNVLEARKILLKIKSHVDAGDLGSDYTELLNAYLTLIPQKVPALHGWGDTFFTKFSSFERQSDFLEQLEVSIKDYQDNIEQQKDNQESNVIQEKLFHRNVRLVHDKDVIDGIKDYFKKTINKNHPSSRLKLINVYELVDDVHTQKFEKVAAKLGNVQQYWHGSRTFNLLSILKSGLIIPKSNAFNTTGRMFGDGVYFSDQSTKALNYSYGVWSGHRDNQNVYMFLADVAMGNVYQAYHDKAIKNAKNNMYPVKGYDSVHAKGDCDNVTQSGYVSHLRNDEMIVYDLDQINLRYLCEFAS